MYIVKNANELGDMTIFLKIRGETNIKIMYHEVPGALPS